MCACLICNKTGRHYCTNRQLIHSQVLPWKKEDEREGIQGKLIILAWHWKAFLSCGFIAKELYCCAYGVGVSLPERF